MSDPKDHIDDDHVFVKAHIRKSGGQKRAKYSWSSPGGLVGGIVVGVLMLAVFAVMAWDIIFPIISSALALIAFTVALYFGGRVLIRRWRRRERLIAPTTWNRIRRGQRLNGWQRLNQKDIPMWLVATVVRIGFPSKQNTITRTNFIMHGSRYEYMVEINDPTLREPFANIGHMKVHRRIKS